MNNHILVNHTDCVGLPSRYVVQRNNYNLLAYWAIGWMKVLAAVSHVSHGGRSPAEAKYFSHVTIGKIEKDCCWRKNSPAELQAKICNIHSE